MMQFFESFSSLGYSAINLCLFFLFFYIVLYRAFKLHQRHWGFTAILTALMVALFIFSTNFLAQQNKMLNDAIRDDGGLKRTEKR